jgi:predicted site-specific integrase-resolvase
MSTPVTNNTRRATPSELACHLGTTPQTVNAWKRRGLIPAVVDEGKLIRFDIEEVDQVLAERAAAKKLEAAASRRGNS